MRVQGPVKLPSWLKFPSLPFALPGTKGPSKLPQDRLELSGPAAPRMLPLPGGMNTVPLLNANHPEIVRGEGISVSTMPWGGKAHLNQAFQGPFQLFTHHQNRSWTGLHQAVVLHNASDRPVRVKVGPSAMASTHSAPYWDHDNSVKPDGNGRRASGPGDRAAGDFLRGGRAIREEEIVLQPGEFRVAHSKRIARGTEATGHFAFEADGPVHAAVVLEAQEPTAERVEARLKQGHLLARNPKDLAPTKPGAPGQLIFGRVSGVQQGSTWEARLTNDAQQRWHDLKPQGDRLSYLLVGKATNTLGTGQDQAAELLKRYPDTAYAAHGNYGVTYDLKLPLRNPNGQAQEVALYFDSPGTPLPLSRVFRGTIELSYRDAEGRAQVKRVHVSQKAGELGRDPLLKLQLPPGASQEVGVRFVYPANSTPPHALRVENRPTTGATQPTK